jgi:predicted kinase
MAQDASEATIEVLEQQLRTQDPLNEDEQSFTVVFDTERDDERAIAQKARQLARLYG